MSEVAIYAMELDAALIAMNASITSDDLSDAELIELYMANVDPVFAAAELVYDDRSAP
jgi:hypothetical protein